MARDGLRLVSGGVEVSKVEVATDPAVFQEACLAAYVASQVARGFSPISMENGAGVLDRFLAACGRPAWEVTREDVDRVVASLSAQGLAAATRRGYVQAFKGFHRFLVARKAPEIEALFGVRLVDPVDEFNAARHVGADSGHLASWAGSCPGNNITGGKRRSGKTTKGDVWLQGVLIECAWAAARAKDTYLQAQFWRLARRIGKKRAAVAVGHSILVIAWHLLSEGCTYEDLGGDFFTKRDTDRARQRAIAQLEALGYKVSLEQAA